MSNPYIVGLTGIIGSGKSLAAGYFEDLGVSVVDTDIISHALTKCGGIAIPQIEDEFGVEYITDGELNRNRMRQLIFADEASRYKLESILHPLIFNEVKKQVIVSGSQYTVVVVPLLFQSPRFLNYITRSIFIDCEIATLIDRVMRRSGISRDQVSAIIKAQLGRGEQLSLADDILHNNKSPDFLKDGVIALHKKYQKLFV